MFVGYNYQTIARYAREGLIPTFKRERELYIPVRYCKVLYEAAHIERRGGYKFLRAVLEYIHQHPLTTPVLGPSPIAVQQVLEQEQFIPISSLLHPSPHPRIPLGEPA